MAAPELSKTKDQDEGLHGCSREALAGGQVLEASEEPRCSLGKVDQWRGQGLYLSVEASQRNCIRTWDDFCCGSKKIPANISPGKTNRLGHCWPQEICQINASGDGAVVAWEHGNGSKERRLRGCGVHGGEGGWHRPGVLWVWQQRECLLL